MRAGYIINIGSQAGLHASKGNAAYAASKWAMTGWSQSCFEVRSAWSAAAYQYRSHWHAACCKNQKKQQGRSQSRALRLSLLMSLQCGALQELREHDIRVTTLFPHYVQSGMTEEVISLEVPKLLFLLAVEDDMSLRHLLATLYSLLRLLNVLAG